jgi:hypothetical protein
LSEDDRADIQHRPGGDPPDFVRAPERTNIGFLNEEEH